MWAFINPPLRLRQTREHVKKMICWRNYCHAWQIIVWTLAPVWCENMQGYFPADITQTFSACILILIASLNCARKSRSSFKMQQRRQINFYNNISEKYNSARNIPKSFPFRLFSISAFINSRIQIWLSHVCVIHQTKKNYFRTSDFTHSKM